MYIFSVLNTDQNTLVTTDYPALHIKIYGDFSFLTNLDTVKTIFTILLWPCSKVDLQNLALAM